MKYSRGVLLRALLCCLAQAGRAAEPDLPPGMIGSWRMTKLVCATCAPNGRLPADLAGGAIRIGPANFDDPLAGACPEPRFTTGHEETMAAFVGQTGDAASRLQRLVPAGAMVIPVAVTCQPPAHAREPVGAKVFLAYAARGMLVRCWEDTSFIVLKRAAPPEDSPTPRD